MLATKNIFHFLTVCLLTYSSLNAQFYNLPGDYFFSLTVEGTLGKKDPYIHNGLQPYIHFFSASYSAPEDSVRLTRRPVLNSFFHTHLIRVAPKNENFKLRLDPLLNFETGRDLAGSTQNNLYSNTRGFIASGHIGNKVYFESMLSENQSVFPAYVSDNARTTLIIPGQGRWKAFKTNGYDYAFSSGFISMQAFKQLNIQVGHGKQKIGHGYRSLLLSDNAFNYPFARITQQWFGGRVQYNNIYAVLMNLDSASKKQTPGTERLFQKKAASFQYLSINAAKFLNIGFFQGLIWQAGDQRNQQHLGWQFFNPLIYTDLAAYGLNNKNNILAGADLQIKVTDEFSVYGQVMADDLSNTNKASNGWGMQAGIKFNKAFGGHRLFLQSEYNNASETSYLSPIGTISNQSYSHYNQNLAFTPGTGSEIVFAASYRVKRFFVDIKYNLLNTKNYGADYYTTTQLNAKAGFIINPAYNLNINAGINYRNQNFHTFNASKLETNYIYIGLKTSIYNLYYDF